MIVIILLVTFFCVSTGFTILASRHMNELKSEIQSNLALNARLVGSNCIVPLTFGDNEQAAVALSSLQHIKDIDIAKLYDKDGKLFSSYPDSLNKATLSVLPKHTENALIGGYFYIYEPVIFQNEKVGTIFIKASSQALVDERRALIFTMSLLILTLSILSVIIASKMQRFISAPIIALKNHFDSIAKSQDFTQRIEKHFNDEIGDLFDDFNNMINQIRNHSDERDKVGKQLRESQEKLHVALEGGDIGIWEWDLNTDVTLWDKNMEKMFGLEEGSFGQTYEDFKECLHPDDIALTEQAIQAAFNDIAPYDVIYRAVWKNKEIKFIRAKALTSRDEEQKPIKMIGVCTDVTEIKEAEIELKKHRETLEDLVEKRTEELQIKYEELEKMNELFVDREFRIKEIRDELASLKSGKES